MSNNTFTSGRRANSNNNLKTSKKNEPSFPAIPSSIHPGTALWTEYKKMRYEQCNSESDFAETGKALRENMSPKMLKHFNQTLYDLNNIYNSNTEKNVKINANENMISYILDRIEENDWLMINGGSSSHKWITSQYNNRKFPTGKIKRIKTGENIFFPIDSGSNDPRGIAFHYKVVGGGQHCTINYNGWIKEGTGPKAEAKRSYYRRKERKKRGRQIAEAAGEFDDTSDEE
jgi:hypothetical protein